MPRALVRSKLVLAGVATLGGAALSGEIAWLHMRWMAATYGAICGSQGLPHCAACPTAAGLLALSLALFAAAARPAPAAVRRRGR